MFSPLRPIRPFVLAAAALATAAVAPLHPLQADLARDVETAWQEERFEGKTPNRWRDGDEGLVVETEASVSMLGRPVRADLARTPLLRWRWRVDTDTPATDLTRKGGDDRAIALYLGFPWIPEQASFKERLTRPLVELAKGADAPGRVISYVWGGDRARGSLMRSPYMGDSGALIVLRPAGTPLNVWQSEEIDIAADYRRAFGAEPPATVTLIGLAADSDDTGSRSRAVIRDLHFAPAGNR